MTRRFVLPLLDVRGHALDAGTTPEVTDRHAHRLRRDSLVAPVLPHPPACFDFVGRDSLNAIARETQLSGTEEAVVPQVPDCPWAEPVLSPFAVQRRGCHATHHPSSPTLVRARLRRAGKEASGSAVPFGEPSLAPPNLLPSVVARLSLSPGLRVIPQHWRRRYSRRPGCENPVRERGE